RTTRAACRLARSYRNNLPHALRERALCLAAGGRIGAARRLLDRSIDVARRQEASYELAQSRAARGRLGLGLGWPGALADQQEGEGAMAALEVDPSAPEVVVEAPSMGALGPYRLPGAGHRGHGPVPGEQDSLARTDRFAALLNAGRTIAAATSVAAVRQALEEAVPVVLRAERCYLVDVQGTAPVPVTTESGEPVDDISTTLITEAISTGQVVTASPSLSGQVADSLILSGVRSALCGPISRGGKVVACFYVTHRDLAGVFGDEERRLAAFMAALAGATLDHVAGSEAHFRALVRNSHDLTIVTDASGRPLYVSPSVTRMLGYSPAEFATVRGIDLIHSDDQEQLRDALGLARFSPATHPTTEVRAHHRDGTWRWLELSISNLLADSSIRGLVWNIRDTTDRKRAELALGQATEQFRLSFENAPIGMALTSIDPATQGWLLRVNQALADLLGYTREDLEGRTMAQITHPDDLAADRAAMARFQTNEAVSVMTEKRYRHADGRWIWVQLQASMVGGDNGPQKYVISQMLDVTERRAAEERLTFLALHDPLTGLANRRLLLDRLSLALARTARTGRMVAVLYLDLDRFKGVNDSWGHDQGDQLLRLAADRLQQLVRDSDTLARLGGDEFVLVADDLVGPAEALAIARRIEESLNEPFDLPGAGLVAISASVGVALATGDADPKTLLRHADVAMYQAKEQGRARYQLFGASAENLG
ncbi:MAG: PAS domain S-box protein, partial [Actinomycetota bacterium]|nr:PAS domain S-box protein [Actinomycetota bacterium]